MVLVSEVLGDHAVGFLLTKDASHGVLVGLNDRFRNYDKEE